MNWTSNQLEAIKSKNKNILVAAAAGSGKTAVLVERIIQKIIKQGIDIDKLLVVTFTNAAASEIRQRVLEAIYEKLEKEPTNENLQKQIILLDKSNISTIHSFCLKIIKNNFFEIGISPDFRIGDTSELELLKLETLEEVFEKLYEEGNQDFIKLTEIYTGYRGDESLKEIILKIYDFIQSSPFPEEWLEENIKKFDLSDKLEDDFGKSEWGKIILGNIKENIERNITELKVLLNELNLDTDLKKYSDFIVLNIAEYEKGLKALETWDKAYNILPNLDFGKWPVSKKIDSEVKDKAKEIRKHINKTYNELVKKLIVTDSENANKDMYEMYNILVYLQNVILKFMETFNSKKQNKNIIDFNDIEHYALKILVKKDEKTGKYIETEVAKSYKEKFHEIAIDEYQDSNLVQEWILSSISNGHNMFMVGDVKQSIYRFRQARPELFLEKYNSFKLKEDLLENEVNQKIQLFNNFRSRELVLEFANLVFKNIMSEKIGSIDYTKEEYLNFTASFEKPLNEAINFAGKMSLEIIDTKDIETEKGTEEDELQTNYNGADYDDDEDDDNEFGGYNKNNAIEDIQENLENIEIEARYVAYRIKEIIDSKYNVFDKNLKQYRPATYKDFVILLRSTSNVAPIFEKEIFKLNMPVYSDASQKYLESIEIETILNLLKIIDNPLQDIPLASVLRSYIGGFNDNELLKIRQGNIRTSFYESMCRFANMNDLQKENITKESTINDNITKEKVKGFLNTLKEWQEIVKYMPLDEFIWKLYIDTGYYNYVSMMNDGNLKIANLKMLFERAKQYEAVSFKGLYNFIKFIDKLKKNQGDLDNAKIIGENDNVIRIMSIHKSKGLEFPIVFLSTTGRKFNLRDLADNILLHQDLGIGPKYINYDRKIEYSTLAKEALKIRLKDDSLSEEMRVLYVALTRPKEKLIITGCVKDANKKIEEKKVLLEISKKENINSLLVKKYTYYIDWLQLAYLNDTENMNKAIDFKVLNIGDIVEKFKDFNSEEKVDNNDIKEFLKNYKFNKSDYEKIENLLAFKYNKQELTKIQSKISVTDLKELLKNKLSENKEESSEEIIKGMDIKNANDTKNNIKKSQSPKTKLVLEIPKFILPDSKLTKAEIGTLTHLVFQKIDFTKKYTLETLKQELEKYVEKEILTQEQKEVIDINKVYNFITSEFATRIRNAEKIYTEAPFYMNVDVKNISKEAANKKLDEKVLVQGIIDLYFEEADGKLVLVDYKTDYIKEGEENLLINRHKDQLLLYKKALEEATNKTVKEIYLYSTCLNKALQM